MTHGPDTEAGRAPHGASSLMRLLQPLDAPPIIDVPAAEPWGDGAAVVGRLGAQPEWIRRDAWRLHARASRDPAPAGTTLDSFSLDDGSRLTVVHTESGAVVVPFGIDDAYHGYITERWRSSEQPRALKPWQLAAFYRVKRLIPRAVQLEARRRLMRRQGVPEFPSWPLDLSVDRLVRFVSGALLAAAAKDELRFRWFWPAPYGFAAILSHDVESAEGLRLALALADEEEARGFRSSFNIVADWYPVDMGIVAELQARGFEIGVHGVHHDRSMFSSRASFEAQQPVVRETARRFDAVGFRSPATHRVIEWIRDLPVEYDCTIPNSDPYEAIPGGCCSPWPFFLGEVVELPYTLVQDHTLFTLLRHRSVELWASQLADLRDRGGLVQVLSHPDPGYLGDRDKLALYCDFLDVLREEDDAWTPLPRDVARWWQARDAGREAGGWTFGDGVIRRAESEAGVSFARA